VYAWACLSPARCGNRAGLPVQPRQISLTAARRMGLDSLTAMTASLPATARCHILDDLLKRLGTERVQVDRHRHRDRVVKTRQAFGHAKEPVTTTTAKAELDLCAPPPPAAATTGTATSTGHDQAADTARRPRRPATDRPQTPANRRNRNGKRRTKRVATTAHPPTKSRSVNNDRKGPPPSRQDHREAIMKI